MWACRGVSKFLVLHCRSNTCSVCTTFKRRIRRVIIDTDPGTDDYLAMALFIKAERKGLVKIEAITCTRGNKNLKYSIKNTMRLLELAKRTDIPVYPGSEDVLVRRYWKPVEDNFFGNDGFGDLKHKKEPNVSIVNKLRSPIAIYNIVTKSPKQISLVCLAPLTNIAIALKLFPDLAANLKDCWIMGGAYKAIGNVTPTAEFNFWADPEAAYIVLKEIQNTPVTILPWEPCFEGDIKITWLRNFVAKKTKDPIMKLFIAAERLQPFPVWASADAIIACCYLYPEEIIVYKEKHAGTVELRGDYTFAQFVIDYQHANPFADIIKKFHVKNFQKRIMEVAGIKNKS